MNFEQLKGLIREVMEEQKAEDFGNHPVRAVASFYKVMNRYPERIRNKMAELYDLMVSSPSDALAMVRDLERTVGRPFNKGLVTFHQRGLSGGAPLPTGKELLDAARQAEAVRKASEKKAAEDRERIQVSSVEDAMSSKRDRRGASWRHLKAPEGSTKDQALKFFRDNLMGAPIWSSKVFVTPEGRFFTVYEIDHSG